MGRVRHPLARMASQMAGGVIGILRVIGAAVLVMPHLPEPGSGWRPERRLSIRVGVIAAGVLALGSFNHGSCIHGS